MAENPLNLILLQIHEEEEEERKQKIRELRLERIHLRDHSNPFEMDSEYFRLHYRLPIPVVMRLVDMLDNRLFRVRRTGIPPYLQVLCVLRFFAEGALQKGFAESLHHPVSQTTASRLIFRVAEAIDELADQFIQFPRNRFRRNLLQNQFQETIRIPGIIGLMDCFLVTFRRPTNNEEAFFNYKVGHAMNVQIVVGPKYEILNIRVCPGSNNDRYVWQHSETKDYMESLRYHNRRNNEAHSYLIADSGYTPSPVVLTPILNAAEGSPQDQYNTELVHTRCKVEQTIGVLTNVWRVIKRCRKLYYSPEKVSLIIRTCAVLHNFRLRHGFPLPVDNFNDEHPRGRIINDFQAGILERNILLRNFY